MIYLLAVCSWIKDTGAQAFERGEQRVEEGKTMA
jgi:hypothetical protein